MSPKPTRCPEPHLRPHAFTCALVAFVLAAPARAEHFLWEVRSMTNSAYLFGTIHAGRKEWFPLPKPIEDALDDSQVLVIEADITDTKAMARTTESMAYAPPDDLTRHVPPADYERFRVQAERLGVPEAALKQLKPFTAVSLLAFAEWARLGFLPEYGIDGYLIARAWAQKKPVVELEGVEAQAKLVDSLTEAQHRTVFAGTLSALEDGLTGEQIEGMAKAWQTGDAFLMLELSRRYNEKVPGAGELEEKFVWSRHEAMLAKVEGYLNKAKERHFVAVGSLHLTGKRGLVEMLRAKGYLVRQR